MNNRTLLLICIFVITEVSAHALALSNERTTKPITNEITNESSVDPPKDPTQVVSAKGTGRTTGHIATLTVKNNTDQPIKIKAQQVYIPSDGKHQSYVGDVPEAMIPPGATITIPVNGYCADVHSPPFGPEVDMTPSKDWRPVGTSPTGADGVSLFPRPSLPTFTLADIPKVTGSTAFTPKPEPTLPPPGDIRPTWPGTNLLIGGTINQIKDPDKVAPVFVQTLNLITQAFDKLKREGEISTPFSPDPAKERESVIQQTFWISMGAITGEEYQQEDFEANVFEQFEDATGVPVSTLQEPEKEKLTSGVEVFWTVFVATGVEAKVLAEKPPESTTSLPEPTTPEMPGEAPVEISERKSGCTGSLTPVFNPPYELDMKITEQWGDAEERRDIIRSVQEAIGTEVQITPDGALEEYDINRHPTSSTSFWKAGTVGGFSSAYAKTYFKKSDGSWDWVWGTERLETNADGTMDFTLAYQHDEKCRAMVAGTALIRIRASSSAFDAMAGNTHLENNTEQLNFLRGTKYAAKISLEWLMLRARGKTNKSFHQHVRDDLQGQIEGEISQAIQAEVEALADQYLGGLLEQMGLSTSDLFNLNLELPDLEGAIEDFFGIDIPNFEDLENFISDGLEASLNLLFVSNTYATANGALIVRVGGNSGDVRAHTSVRYGRQSTEETSEAIQWTGEDCKEALVSDALPDALTIHTTGFSNMVAEAASRFGFGNGQAEAFLESMDLQVLTGICICEGQRPGIDQSTYELEVQGQMGWYTASQNYQSELRSALESMLQQVEDQMLEELDGMSEDQVNQMTPDQFEQMLRGKVSAWADANKFAWSACD